MSAASRDDISTWFDEGIADKRAYMIIVCDTFDHSDYPVYADDDEQCRKEYEAHNGPNMQRVMEVYDLRKTKASQMKAKRAMNLPAGKET